MPWFDAGLSIIARSLLSNPANESLGDLTETATTVQEGELKKFVLARAGLRA